MDEDAQRAHPGEPQHRRDQRAGEAEHEQQRREVADHQVLDHVRPEDLVRGPGDRRDERREQHQHPAREARDPPARDGPRGAAQAPHADDVERARRPAARSRPGRLRWRPARRCRRRRSARMERTLPAALSLPRSARRRSARGRRRSPGSSRSRSPQEPAREQHRRHRVERSDDRHDAERAERLRDAVEPRRGQRRARPAPATSPRSRPSGSWVRRTSASPASTSTREDAHEEEQPQDAEVRRRVRQREVRRRTRAPRAARARCSCARCGCARASPPRPWPRSEARMTPTIVTTSPTATTRRRARRR